MKDLYPATKQTLTGNTLRALAFSLLAKREYSKHDLRQKLLSYAANPEEVESLLNDLIQENYQNDERMTGMLIRSQIRQGRGPQRIQQALKKHDLDQEIAQQELTDIDWFQQALQLKIKKFGVEVTKEPKQKAKQIRFLQYRGFDMETIFKVIQYTEDD